MASPPEEQYTAGGQAVWQHACFDRAAGHHGASDIWSVPVLFFGTILCISSVFYFIVLSTFVVIKCYTGIMPGWMGKMALGVSVYVYVCLSMCMFVCLSICVFVCRFVFV